MLVTLISALAVLFGLGICFACGAFSNLHWLWILPLSFAGAWLLLLILSLAVLWLVCRNVDMTAEQTHDDLHFRKFVGMYADMIIALTMRLKITGQDKLPTKGRFLLVCNHLSDLDPVVLLHAFPKAQLAFISKRENASMPIVGQIMHRIMCQMINRENNREALKTIIRCVRLIQEDEVSIAVFPEGYTSRSGKLQHMRSGVFKIALKTGVPVVVCTIRGTNDVLKPFPPFSASSVHLGRKVELHLVDIIAPESYQSGTAVDLGDRVYRMMLADLGEGFAPEEKAAE